MSFLKKIKKINDEKEKNKKFQKGAQVHLVS